MCACEIRRTKKRRNEKKTNEKEIEVQCGRRTLAKSFIVQYQSDSETSGRDRLLLSIIIVISVVVFVVVNIDG